MMQSARLLCQSRLIGPSADPVANSKFSTATAEIPQQHTMATVESR
jgi:hypothetical protein